MPHRRPHPLLFVPLALFALACDGDPPAGDGGIPDTGIADATMDVDAGPEFPEFCENVSPAHCLMPWPSSFFLGEDSSTATGRRIRLPEEAMPRNNRNRVMDPAQFDRFDGFSPMTSIATAFAGELDGATLHDENAIEETLSASSTTIIVDAETGELVAHFAEVDTWPVADPARTPLYLRPATRLEEGRRYVVGIHGLRYVGGADVEASRYFAALRDGDPLEGSDIEARRAHFEDIFGVLTDAEVPRAGLIQAWDFVTATGETIWGDLITIRDDALERLGDNGIGCTITSTSDNDHDNQFRVIHGTVTVPLYTMGETFSSDDARLNRNEAGEPAFNRLAEVPFRAQIPRSLYDSVRDGGEPGRLQIYGHGLFGGRGEIGSGWHRDHQDRLGMVSVAVDWWGMSSDDVARVALTLQEFSDFFATGERLQQSIINFIAVTRSFQGACADLPELAIPLEAGGTAPSFDPSAAYYYGNSQGGIMGGVLAAASTDIEAFSLGVGGMSYPIMIKRSVNWRTYDNIMANGYPDPFVRDLMMVMSASLWDLAEPSTYSPHLVRDPLPGTPVKRILMQIGFGDAQVPAVSAYLQARTIGIPYLSPTPDVPWGMDSTDGDVPSALVIYQIPGVDALVPGTRSPGEDNAAHEAVRRADAAIEQMDRFFRPDGLVEQTCDGVCDPN